MTSRTLRRTARSPACQTFRPVALLADTGCPVETSKTVQVPSSSFLRSNLCSLTPPTPVTDSITPTARLKSPSFVDGSERYHLVLCRDAPVACHVRLHSVVAFFATAGERTAEILATHAWQASTISQNRSSPKWVMTAAGHLPPPGSHCRHRNRTGPTEAATTSIRPRRAAMFRRPTVAGTRAMPTQAAGGSAQAEQQNLDCAGAAVSCPAGSATRRCHRGKNHPGLRPRPR